MMTTMMARKPLMLKDYLELDDDDDDSDSGGSSGLAGPVTIRRLLDAELRGGSGRLVPAHALTKLSAAINPVKLLPFSSDGRCLPSGRDGCLSGSFSERLRGSLWKKKKNKERAAAEENMARVKNSVRPQSVEASGEGWRSLRFPSPVASSRSSWSETDSSGSDFLPTSMASSDSPNEIPASTADGRKESPSPNPNPSSEKRAGDEESEDEGIARVPARELDNNEVEFFECNSEEEEKEQLSPVSVIDYEESIAAATSPTFYRTLANIERTKEQLLHRIRRFEMLAELDPTDLEAESTDHVASSDAEAEEERARSLLSELKARPLEEGPRGSTERLLMDFFIQGQSRSGDAHRGRPLRWGRTRTSSRETSEMLSAARDWIDGRRCRDLDDRHAGEATLREMEGDGRWRCFDEEEAELGLHLEGAMFQSLMEELVHDLASR